MMRTHSIRSASVLALVVFAFAGTAVSQTARAAGIQAQIDKLRAEQDKQTFRQRRLTHLRLRHLLGLPMRSASEDPARLTEAQSEIVLLPTLQQDRDAALADVEASVMELQQLSADLERLAPGGSRRLEDRLAGRPAAPIGESRNRAGARRIASSLDGIALEDPVGGDTRHVDGDHADEMHTPQDLSNETYADDGEAVGDAYADSIELGGPVVLIDGSNDKSLVGRQLLEAGFELMRRSDRALAAGRPAEAEDFRAQAMERLERARSELRPFADAPETENLPERFFLARAEERLGDTNAAYKLYLHVQKYDRVADPASPRGYVLGRWGRASDFASSVMRWRQEVDAFQPNLDLRLPWETESAEGVTPR